METTTEKLQVAKTIADQIGGKAFFMLGARLFVGGENFLMFAIRGSKRVNKIRVELNARDLYDVTFYKIWKYNAREISKKESIYFDQLHQIIEQETGLKTSLF